MYIIIHIFLKFQNDCNLFIPQIPQGTQHYEKHPAHHRHYEECKAVNLSGFNGLHVFL
jgi:hypothetical protein